LTKISIENIKSLASKAFISHSREVFGAQGESAIVELLDAVKLIYQRCPPERLKSTLTVVRPIGTTPLAPVIAAFGQVIISNYYEDLAKLPADCSGGNARSCRACLRRYISIAYAG
jgi:hypothetical protein